MCVMQEVIFFSTHCPRCKMLETVLKQKKIKYKENNDVEDMLALGLRSAPGLKVGDEVMDFPTALAWAKRQ